MNEIINNACKGLYGNLEVTIKYYGSSIIDKIEFFANISIPSEDICERNVAFNNKYKCIEMNKIHTINVKEFIEKFVENVIDNAYVECHKNVKIDEYKTCWLNIGYIISPFEDKEAELMVGDNCDFVEIDGTLVKDNDTKLTSGAIYRWKM